MPVLSDFTFNYVYEDWWLNRIHRATCRYTRDKSVDARSRTWNNEDPSWLGRLYLSGICGSWLGCEVCRTGYITTDQWRTMIWNHLTSSPEVEAKWESHLQQWRAKACEEQRKQAQKQRLDEAHLAHLRAIEEADARWLAEWQQRLTDERPAIRIEASRRWIIEHPEAAAAIGLGPVISDTV